MLPFALIIMHAFFILLIVQVKGKSGNDVLGQFEIFTGACSATHALTHALACICTHLHTYTLTHMPRGTCYRL